jgi:hypothetical protein
VHSSRVLSIEARVGNALARTSGTGSLHARLARFSLPTPPAITMVAAACFAAATSRAATAAVVDRHHTPATHLRHHGGVGSFRNVAAAVPSTSVHPAPDPVSCTLNHKPCSPHPEPVP